MIKKPMLSAAFAAGAALLAMNVALAAPIISLAAPSNPTGPNTPFALESFGSGGSGLISANSSLGLSAGTVTYSGATTGIFAGDVALVSTSPLRNAVGAAAAGRYLTVSPGGSITISYGSLQSTVFNLLWGTIDPVPATYNTITFGGVSGTEVVTAADLATLAGFPGGNPTLAVTIANLNPFTTVTFTASNVAFEFVPGVRVSTPIRIPEPASLALLGTLLLVGSLVRARIL